MGEARRGPAPDHDGISVGSAEGGRVLCRRRSSVAASTLRRAHEVPVAAQRSRCPGSPADHRRPLRREQRSHGVRFHVRGGRRSRGLPTPAPMTRLGQGAPSGWRTHPRRGRRYRPRPESRTRDRKQVERYQGHRLGRPWVSGHRRSSATLRKVRGADAHRQRARPRPAPGPPARLSPRAGLGRHER